jgi:hypothetical protein
MVSQTIRVRQEDGHAVLFRNLLKNPLKVLG